MVRFSKRVNLANIRGSPSKTAGASITSPSPRTLGFPTNGYMSLAEKRQPLSSRSVAGKYVHQFSVGKKQIRLCLSQCRTPQFLVLLIFHDAPPLRSMSVPSKHWYPDTNQVSFLLLSSYHISRNPPSTLLEIGLSPPVLIDDFSI